MTLTVQARRPSSNGLLGRRSCLAASCLASKQAFSSKQVTYVSLAQSVEEAASKGTASKISVRLSKPHSTVKRGSSYHFLTMTGEFSPAGPGPWLIPMVLPAGESEHDSSKLITVSLSANPPSQLLTTYSYLSVLIASITGDYRQLPISNILKDTSVCLLGYSVAILYCFSSPTIRPLYFQSTDITLKY